MSTINLQLNANTANAVGAFNAFTNAVLQSRRAVDVLNVTIGRGTQANQRYGNSLTSSLTGAFGKFTSIVSTTISILERIGAATQFAFSSILRELDKIQGFHAIMSVSVKSTDAVTQSYAFLRRTADQLGVQFDALTGNYAKLVAALPEGTDRIRIAERVFMGLAMASRTLHASNQDTQLMFYAITQMASKGVVSMEELRRQLGEKLPGVLQIAAKALNTTADELEKAIRKGVVNSAKFLPIFGDALIRTFAESSEIAATSVSASLNRLTNVWVDFVKEILDSGAGQAIVGVFDALREKLSDPYVIARFSELIKEVAERVSTFVNNITADDLRNGFDTAARVIGAVVTILEKFAKLLQWIIDNGGKAGAIIGALGGASAGATIGLVTAGPVGALVGAGIGAAAGAAGGGYLGYQATASTPAEDLRRMEQDLAARQRAEQAKADRNLVQYQMLIPILQNFKGLNSFKDVQGLFKPERLTRETITQIAGILGDKTLKSDADRLSVLKDFAKTGIVLSPQSAQLTSVLNPIGKVDRAAQARQRSEDSTFAKAYGLNPDYIKQLTNLNSLLKQGRLNQDKYNEAVQDLIAKQPYMVEYTKEQNKEQAALAKSTSDLISWRVKQIETYDDIVRGIDQELKMAGLRSDQVAEEQGITQIRNQMLDTGRDLTVAENVELREKLRLIESIRAATAAEQQVLSATVDRWLPQIQMVQGIEKALADPSSGLTRPQAQEYIAIQDPMAQGSQEWMDAQRRSLEEYYIFVDMLRQKDLVSEQTSQMMKARAALDADQMRIENARGFFGNLASLSQSGNKKIAAIGKAAATAQATIDGYVAVQKALTAAPPPWNYALAAAVGVAAAANVAKIAGIGFASGGYTGDMSRSSVAGVVHGQEFVVNASATAKNRATLEAMNRGQSVNQGAPGESSVRVIVNNNAPETRATAQERNTPNGKEIEVTIERVVIGSIRSGGRIASAMEGQYGLNRSVGAIR